MSPLAPNKNWKRQTPCYLEPCLANGFVSIVFISAEFYVITYVFLSHFVFSGSPPWFCGERKLVKASK